MNPTDADIFHILSQCPDTKQKLAKTFSYVLNSDGLPDSFRIQHGLPGIMKGMNGGHDTASKVDWEE
jgi:hypothetical protein